MRPMAMMMAERASARFMRGFSRLGQGWPAEYRGDGTVTDFCDRPFGVSVGQPDPAGSSCPLPMKTSLIPVLGSFVALSVALSAAPDPNWLGHDRERPLPPVVKPGTFSTQEQPGVPPSDAI